MHIKKNRKKKIKNNNRKKMLNILIFLYPHTLIILLKLNLSKKVNFLLLKNICFLKKFKY
ncbi:hypothetical protein DD681_02030 [Buchnera aphidicola (Melanaphis sacchari)]|uniref:Uncharacterized protein n=1 Tax=Buchnera aphidicola (Melanaphis sacchari) TaxID=2173854 RepID=A0A2U8DFI2_9GAMM|nr:hypothetical protein DD681_02030 [Buchnera aphidicola (Melanaphis sacchari)]